MIRNLLHFYKLPLILSIVIGIAILASATVRTSLGITQVMIGAILGTFVLDLEYFLNAYILDPGKDFSKTLKGFVRDKDWGNTMSFIQYHKNEAKENALNSALFQVVLVALSIFVAYASPSLFAQALIISVFAQSIYVVFEHYYKDSTDDWFWMLNDKPTKAMVQLYLAGLVVALGAALLII